MSANAALRAKATDASISVEPYAPSFHTQVVAHITSIQQQEFGLPIVYEDQFDLKDMTGTYQSGAGNFWVALMNGEVVGTVGLIDAGDHTAALKKMFVRADCRGKDKAVAQTLLETLLQWARQKNIRHLYLGTTERFLAAQRFYERNGFSVIADDAIPASILRTRAKVDTKHYYRSVHA